MRVAVVLSTYNQPAALEKVLWGYSVQTHRAFEVVVADDGSTAETADLLERLRGVQIRYRAPCLHLHHARPYVDRAVVQENRRLREAIRREHRVRATRGIDELRPGLA